MTLLHDRYWRRPVARTALVGLAASSLLGAITLAGFPQSHVAAATSRPQEDSSAAPPHGPRVGVSGTWVYVPQNGGLAVVSVANPRQPRLIDQVTTSVPVTTVLASGPLLVAGGHDRVLVLDLSSPDRPREVGQYVLRPPAGQVLGGLRELIGAGQGRVWAQWWSEGTHDVLPFKSEHCELIDLTDPARVISLGAFGRGSGYREGVGSVTASDTYGSVVTTLTLIAGVSSGVTTYDVRQPDHVVELGSWQVGYARYGRSRIIDHWLYIDVLWPAAPYRLLVYDLTAPTDPEPVAALPDVWAPAAVSGRRAYSVADRVTLLDVADPGRPLVGGWLPVPGTADGIAADGEYAYLLAHAGWQRLYVIDASRMRQPVYVGMVELSARPDQWSRRFLPLVPR